MKTRFLLGVLLLFSITMQGQQVKVNYENITNSLPIILQEYFRMQGVQHLNLTIKGEFNGKRAKLKKIYDYPHVVRLYVLDLKSVL